MRSKTLRNQDEYRDIAARALGRPLREMEYVHHIDRNPLNNSNSNLVICDPRYHLWLHRDDRDMPKGEGHYKSKLTEEDVINIRNDPRTTREIAKDYPIGKTQVHLIKTRQNWKHIK